MSEATSCYGLDIIRHYMGHCPWATGGVGWCVWEGPWYLHPVHQGASKLISENAKPGVHQEKDARLSSRHSSKGCKASADDFNYLDRIKQE